MIHRTWRGLARRDAADAYVAHLRRDTLPALDGIEGFAGAEILRRDTERGVEFVVVTRWTSLDAIRAFAGADFARAVVPPEARALMVEFDETVRHYDRVE